MPDLAFRAGARLPLQVEAADIEEYFLAKEPRASGSFRDMGAAEHARAFTVAGSIGVDIVDDLYFALVDNVAAGGTEADFSKRVIPTLKAKGWLGGDDGRIAHRVALIYDTNLRVARGAGRWTRYQATKAVFPYLRGITVGDDRVRHPPKSKHSDHRAWDGIVLPVDHEFWTRWWPPLGFRCRCSVIQMTRSQFARRGGGITSDDELAEREARLGAPVFLSPVAPIGRQLVDAVERTNEPPPRREGGWSVGSLDGLSADQANLAIEARAIMEAGGRMEGLPPVDPAITAAQGESAWRAILDALAFDQLDAALAKLFGLA